MSDPTNPSSENNPSAPEPLKPAEAAPPHPERIVTDPASAPADSSESASNPAPGKDGKKPKNPKTPGRWRRRMVRTFIVLVVAAIGFQILLTALLPWTLRRAAAHYDLDLTCDRPDIYLLSSDAGLWHVKVSQHGQPIASVDYARADISILNLLRGRLVIQRLEADGVDLTVVRNADGTVPLLKSVLFAGPQPGAAPPVVKTPGAKPAPIDLRPPVAIDALVLTHVRTHVIDQAVTPELNTEVSMNLRLTDLSSPVRPVRFTMDLVPSPMSPPLFDSIAVEAMNKKMSDSKSLEIAFHVKAGGLHPKLLAGYLSPFGVKVTAEGISMGAAGNIAVNVMPNNPDAITGKVTLHDIGLSADGQNAATMKSIAIDVDSLSPGSAVVGKIELDNGNFLAERTAAGGLRVAGLELTPGGSPVNTTQPASAVATDPGAAPSAPASSTPALVWSLGEFTLKDFAASFKDAAVTPAADLEFNIGDLTFKNIIGDPANLNAPVAISGNFIAPGIARDIRLSGTCLPFATKKTVDLSVNVAGIRPDALAPYLALFNIDSDLKDAGFSCNLSADVTQPTDTSVLANARLHDIKFKDDHELFALDDVKIVGIGLTPGSVKVESIDVAGPRAAMRREKSGAIWAAGFRLNPVSAKPQTAVSGKTTGQAVTSGPPTTKPALKHDVLASLPKIDIGRFSWNGVKLDLDDEAAAEGESTSLSIEDAGIELTGLHIDFDPNAPASTTPAHVHAFLKAPGLAGNVDLAGTIQQQPGGLVADVELTGDQLSAILAAPYLKALNIQPTMRDGAVHANAHVDVTQDDERISANLQATDFKLSDDGGELLAADKAAISEIRVSDGLLEVGEISLDKPRGQFEREQGGALRAVGFRLVPTPPAPKKSSFAAVSDRPVPITSPTPATLPAATQPTAPADVLVLKKFSIHEGTFGWTDGAVKPIAKITARVDGTLDDITWGKVADPAKLAFTLKADGILDEAKISGTLAATPDSANTKLDISATGLRQGALVSYLPPGLGIELKDGRFHTHLDGNVALDPGGAICGELAVSSLDYRDGVETDPLLSVESVKVSAPKIDILAGVIAIDEVTVAGVQVQARKAKDGSLHAMGVAITTLPPVAPATQPAGPATQPVVAQASTDVPEHLASAGPIAMVKPKYPLVTLQRLSLNVRGLTFVDESREKTPPIVVSDLWLFATKPIEVLGKDAATLPPTDLALTLRVNNVIDALGVNLQVAPFAADPTVVVDVTGTGIHGDGLLAQVPDLKEQIDASQLTDGRLHAHFGAKLKIDRFDPLDFPLNRAFDVDADVKNVEFRSAAQGPVLIGVEEVRTEGVHVHPATGVLVKTLEVENIVGQATREKDGIHALGIVLKIPQAPTNPPAAAAPSVHPTTAPVIVVAAGKGHVNVPAAHAQTVAKVDQPPAVLATRAPTTRPTMAPASPPAPIDDSNEIRISKLFVTGMDFRVQDNTVSPPLIVPLNQLDLDVRNLSTKAIMEARPPTRFSLLVGAGKVPLRIKDTGPAKPIIPIPLGVSAKTKKIDPATGMEERDLFSQVQADGELVFYPQPKGWLKASVSAFDLAELTSTVKQFGVDLSNGVFDASIDTRLPGDGSLSTDSHFIVTDLDLSEAPDGPIKQKMRFPAPTDVVIGVLDGADGSIDVPLAISVKNGNLTTGEIIDAGINAFGAIVTRALASAPAKTVNAVGSVVSNVIPLQGIFGSNEPKPEVPLTLTFAAGDDALSATDVAQLVPLLERMKKEPNVTIALRGELTGGSNAATGDLNQMKGDIGRARVRANPSKEECRELINRLSRRKDDLLRRRINLLGQARADVASGTSSQAAIPLENLRAVERELAATEDALDRLYDLERPGAERQAGRRTKQTALVVARSRQALIRDFFAAGGIADLDQRVSTTRPQFSPVVSDDAEGGSVVITTVVKKKTT